MGKGERLQGQQGEDSWRLDEINLDQEQERQGCEQSGVRQGQEKLRGEHAGEVDEGGESGTQSTQHQGFLCCRRQDRSGQGFVCEGQISARQVIRLASWSCTGDKTETIYRTTTFRRCEGKTSIMQ